ncbi:MAG: hypothetical protein NTV80_25180, partial [Verrucomicrobia bacterium]|nr:hypothetical protein [Verrucomicrobiota bacterium]
MNSANASQNSYQRKFDQALRNTEIHPWQKKSDWDDKSMNGLLELRWIPEQPSGGSSLMTFAKKSNPPTPQALSESSTWVGLKKADLDLLNQEINNWLERNVAVIGNRPNLRQIVIVVGPFLERVTCG